MIPTEWKDIVKESSPLIAFMMLVEIAGGGMLEHLNYIFYSIPSILALIPLINAVGGNAGSVIGSRISSGLHLGTIKPNIRDREIEENMYVVASLAFGAQMVSATFLYLIFPIMGIDAGIDMIKWLEITLISAGIAILVVTPSAVFATIFSFRKGKSPDDFVIPVVSTLGDFIGILSILIALKMVIP